MKRKIECGSRTFLVNSEIALEKIEITKVSEENGVFVYGVDFAFEGGKKSGNVDISVFYPMQNVLQLYSPVTDYKRDRMVWQWFNPTRAKSNFYFGIPMLAAIENGKTNYVTVAVSDAENDNAVSFCVRDFDENDEVEFRCSLLCGREKKSEYSAFIRLDERRLPMWEVLKEQTEWFSAFYPQPSGYPEICELPLYSSWYSFHQHPSADKLCEELEIAAKLGFKSVIVDDGWQYDGNGTSDYIDCGDWAFSREKFPDPKAFTDRVHELGMQVALWFPVPFVGFNTAAYAKFKDKLLYEDGGNINAGVLDLRYKEVREHIVGVVKELMSYGFDGMKLDFIDSFLMRDETPDASADMDVKDLNAATVQLTAELCEGIRQIKKDAMIEFRQNYVGPSIVRYGNMLRVADCAFDSVTNRIGVADLRLLGYNVAVHSDMLLWGKNETDENVARQLLNVLFGVPQISVKLTQMPESHIRVLKNYIEYWDKNRKTLLHGGFEVEGEDCTYTALTARGEDKDIVALYLKNDFRFCGKTTDLFNASRSENVFIDAVEQEVFVKIYDLYGNLVTDKRADGVFSINVPIGGRAEIIPV